MYGYSLFLNTMQSFKVMQMTCNLTTDTSTWKHFPVPSLRLELFSNYFAIKIICKCIHLYWVLNISICRDVRGCMNSTWVQLRFTSILRPCLEDFCSRLTRITLKFLIRKVRGRKNSISVQIYIPIFIYASLLKVISLIKILIILK